MKLNTRYQPPQEGVLTSRQFTRLVMAGKIVDGRAGGLIFGRTFPEGGVMAIYKLGTEYVIRGHVEGGEFAVNWQAATQNLKRLQMMNSGLTIRERVKAAQEDSPPEISQLIMTSAQPNDRLVYLHWAQVVVNREATAKHIGELTEMNKAPNPYLECDHYELFTCQPGTEDGII